jgi:hypothetical protein
MELAQMNKMHISQLLSEIETSIERIGSWSRPLKNLNRLFNIKIEDLISHNNGRIVCFIKDADSEIDRDDSWHLYVCEYKIIFFIENHFLMKVINKINLFGLTGVIIDVKRDQDGIDKYYTYFVPNQEGQFFE